MSTIVVIEQSEKRRAELRSELAVLDQRMQTMTEEMRNLDEKLTAKLEDMVNEKRAASEKLESQKMNMEKQLDELQGNPESSTQSSSATVRCQHCGSENVANAKFCESCGKNIE